MNLDSFADGHDGEVYTCAYTPDGSSLISGGWDGELRLWAAANGKSLGSIRASAKAISACSVSPLSLHFVTGCLEGFLTFWDSIGRQRVSSFVAHGRPVSAIVVDPTGQFLVTGSWDGCINLWDMQRENQSRSMNHHKDVVAGCRLTPDARHLLSWSYDGTICLWDFMQTKLIGRFPNQNDRVTAAGVSPDGRLAASGTRGGTLKLWNMKSLKEEASLVLPGEIRGCFFLLDGESLVVVDDAGRLTQHELPKLTKRAELHADVPVICADLAPAGDQLALGCKDGHIRFVTLEQSTNTPIVIMAAQSTRRTANAFQRLFGRSKLTRTYRCTCPICRQSFEISQADSIKPVGCPNCRRALRIADVFAAATVQVGGGSGSWQPPLRLDSWGF
jgi:hypothetical protein